MIRPLTLLTAAIAFVLGGLSTSSAQAAAAPAERKPNVIVLLGDDLGYSDLGAQGGKVIPTPHIDSIAQNGVRCTQGYVSGPYCSPTRAGLITGRYQTRFGHEFNEGQNVDREAFGLPLSETTFAQRMKALGYATAAVGKWHLGFSVSRRPFNRGYDEFFGTLANTTYFHPNLVDSRIGPDPKRVEDDAFYTTDAYAQRAVEFIAANKDRPFYLYLPFNACHVPNQATEKYLARFPQIAAEQSRIYAAEMSAMDDAVGRVLGTLREHGLEDNTLIVFLSDNGGPMTKMGPNGSNNRPLKGQKGDTWEGGIRVPFLIQWKGHLPAGKVYDEPVIQLDILPTAVAAAGGEVSSDWKLDGVNLIPYLKGEAEGEPHEFLYWRFGPEWAVRQGDWKLVQGYDYDADQAGLSVAKIRVTPPMLFNIERDPGETTDLAAKRPNRVKALQAAWEAWNRELMPPAWIPGPPKS
jgi:arylsulfatase A-like enzyme